MPQSLGNPYTAVESRKVVNGIASFKVNIVNLNTGAVEQSHDIPSDQGQDELFSPVWRLLDQFVPDADGLGAHAQGNSLLALIQGGKIMLQDLSGKSLGALRQASSLADACTIEREDTYLSADGKHVWLRVTSAGPDHNCSVRDDNPTWLVWTDMDASTAPVASGPASGKEVIMGLSNTGSALEDALVLDRDTRTLAVWSPDLKTKRYDVTASGHTLAANEAAHGLMQSPVNARQGLVQLGSALYVADWNGVRLTLNTPVAGVTLAGSTTASDTPVMSVDASTYYVGEDNRGWAIASNGSVLGSWTLPADRGSISNIRMLGNGIVIEQDIDGSNVDSPGETSPVASPLASEGIKNVASVTPVAATTAPQSSLWFVSKVTFQPSLIDAGESLFTLAGNGADLVYGAQGDDGHFTIYKVQAATGLGKQSIASEVQFAGFVAREQVRFGTDPVDQLLWCTPTSLAGCANGKLTAYSVASGQKTEMGDISLGGNVGISMVVLASDLTWAGRNGVLVLLRALSNGDTDYQLLIGSTITPGSLQRVTGQP